MPSPKRKRARPEPREPGSAWPSSARAQRARMEKARAPKPAKKFCGALGAPWGDSPAIRGCAWHGALTNDRHDPPCLKKPHSLRFFSLSAQGKPCYNRRTIFAGGRNEPTQIPSHATPALLKEPDGRRQSADFGCPFFGQAHCRDQKNGRRKHHAASGWLSRSVARQPPPFLAGLGGGFPRANRPWNPRRLARVRREPVRSAFDRLFGLAQLLHGVFGLERGQRLSGVE